MKSFKIEITLGYYGTRTEAEFVRDAAREAAEVKADQYRSNVSSRTALAEVATGMALMETRTNLGRIPEIEQALKTPWEYEVSRSAMGWTLAEVGSEIALSVSKADALRVIAAMESDEAHSATILRQQQEGV